MLDKMMSPRNHGTAIEGTMLNSPMKMVQAWQQGCACEACERRLSRLPHAAAAAMYRCPFFEKQQNHRRCNLDVVAHARGNVKMDLACRNQLEH